MVEQDAPDVDWDDVYRALSNGTRRRILQDVIDENGMVTEAELVDRLGSPATVTADGGEPERDVETADRIRMHLTHVHLPQLDNARLVDWNRATGTVSLTQFSTRLPVALVRPTVVHGEGATGVQGAGD